MRKEVTYEESDEVAERAEGGEGCVEKEDYKKAKTLKNDVTDCFVPAGGPFLSSKNKYMNYIGYAMTAYKTAVNVRGVMKFFAGLF